MKNCLGEICEVYNDSNAVMIYYELYNILDTESPVCMRKNLSLVCTVYGKRSLLADDCRLSRSIGS